MCTWSSLMSATRMQHVSVRVFLVFAVFYALSMQDMCSFFLHRAPEYLHVTYMHIDSTRFLSRTDGAYPIQRTPTCKQDHATHCILGVLPW